MSEIINLEEKKLSKLTNEELVAVALEKASKQILEQGRIIISIDSRLKKIEKELDNYKLS